MEIIEKIRRKKNTRHLEITALNNSIDELNNNMVAMLKLIVKLAEKVDKDDRDGKRDINGDEVKRTHRGRPKKVCSN